ncbi:Rieske (2Fe-2S) protein [Aureliella helgolandensis]|uniref:Ferredoxin CarAc n=1 Tax=Aureliella helgolandensis TaxID=2527968 RepID=A0A518GCG2_9BACT|nr:non-heme iron oxygenase ferredoxin subunit [Aureliella helgolandensis]QDV26285.1 Ferredoxin CarAc [Aureliella helgolandensis]
MSEFVVAAKTSDIPPGGKFCTEVEDRFVVIVHLGDEYYCLDDVCTHDGGPLGEGELDGFCLVCPRHGAKFDVRTGEPTLMPATEPTAKHEVRVEGDSVLVRING